MNIVLAVVEMRSDWPAFNEMSGTRTWSHARYPCPVCDCPLAGLKQLGGITQESLPWNLYTHAGLLADIASHVIAPLWPLA